MEALKELPPGFGFHPTDIELISHYLKKKVLGLKIDDGLMPEIDIYKFEPWDLPGECRIPTRDSKWHFFASRDKKYPNGTRSNRATVAGYWKSTGKDRDVKHHKRVLGTKKTLVFHEGRPPCGKRTEWIMHEYYLNENECKDAPGMKDAFVLCRVTKRDGWGPWGLDVHNVTVQPQHQQPENVADSSNEQKEVSSISNHPKDVPSSVAQEKPSTPSESAEDIEKWVDGLIDHDFLCIATHDEVKNEPEEELSALNTQFLPEVAEDSHLLFQAEDFYEALQSDPQNYGGFAELGDFGSMQYSNLENFDAFSDFGYFNALSDHQVDIVAALNDDGFAPNFDNDETCTGIQIRRREAKPTPTTSSTLNQQRIRLQTSKMESKAAGKSLCGVIKVEPVAFLDHYDDKHADPVVAPAAEESDALSTMKKKRHGGFMRGLSGLFGCCCSSESMNCFVVGACVMGAAALVFSLVRSFSALEL